MVNSGKPSYGCISCRKVHQKCDEVSPACSRCVRVKRKCEYPDSLNITFRDESWAIEMKIDRRRRQARKSSSPTGIRTPGTSESVPICVVPPLRYISTSPEDFAVAVLFSRRAGANQNSKDPRSFMYFLPQLFGAAKANDPLARATTALALFTCHQIIDYNGTAQPSFQMGRKALGEALRLTHHAIQDPGARNRDDTLMAVMVLDIIDKLLCLVDQRTLGDVHISGASQLIKLRGPNNLKSVVSQRMLAGILSETTGKALGQCVPVNAVAEGICSVDQPERLAESPDSAVDRLNYLASRVANIQAIVRTFLDHPSLSGNTQAGALLATVLKSDQELLAWESCLPPAWHPRPAADLCAASLAAFEAYGTTMDIYTSVWIANTYNSFRMLRILLQTLAYDITSCHPQTRKVVDPHGPVEYASTVQRLIGDVCASVPSCMGNRKVGVLPAQIIYPAATGDISSSADRQVTLQVGAWLLRAPLKMCATSRLIDERQRVWIESQIDRINRVHDLRGSHQGLVPNWQISLTSKSSSLSGSKNIHGTVCRED